MFRRVVLEVIRPKNTDDFRICADTYLARFAHLIGGSILVHDVHGYYRIHGSNMFSKNMVFGDGVKPGAAPKSVGEMTRRTMIEKLCSDKIFPAILSDQHFASTLARLAKRRDEIGIVLKSGYLKSDISTKLRRKFRRRVAKAFLKSLVGLKPSKS
jgi:hypothetical protein